jgi:hypothetical protein
MLIEVRQMLKRCSCCETDKPQSAFTDREDNWGLYSWCNDCRKLLDRDKVTPKQAEFVEKTRIFRVRS